MDGQNWLGDAHFGFDYGGNDLFIVSSGSGCGSSDECVQGQSASTGPRDHRRLVGAIDGNMEPYELWELWRLYSSVL
jgi:hypothetical protein